MYVLTVTDIIADLRGVWLLIIFPTTNVYPALMTNLHEDWLTNGLLDFEYKKYLALAYMQGVKQKFEEKKLYPFMSDLVFHYNNLTTIRQNKQLLFENFPKELTRADFEQLKLDYRRIVEDDQLMDTLSEVVNFAIPRFKERMDQGVVLYEDIAYHISIEPIGITPLYKDEGYLLLFINNTKTVYVHQYKITVFEQANESYRAIRTELLEEMQWSLANTFEHIKRDLIKRNRHLPNPAAYLALSRSHYPLQETLLPITKRLLVQHIGQAA